jgi:hypothetical protein
MERQCNTCKYWVGNREGTRMGDCRRYAPRPGVSFGWPKTNPDDWCGEYKSKEQVE